jgi:UDP-2,3-diacylglucosamine pyrophosphatase LpxH
MPGPVAALVPTPIEPLTRRSRRWRSLFLSDLHLGSSRGRPQHVVDFLNHATAETLTLVGDIFDGWNPRAVRGKPGPDHRILLDRLEKFAADGVKIVLVPGNHDAAFRRLSGQTVGPMQVCEETHHRLADGRSMLVTHGDGADPLMALGAGVGWAGARLDALVRAGSRGVNALRKLADLPPSRLIEDLLIEFNTALHPRATYATRLTTRARDLGFQGVICGHYHIPAISQIDGMTYANCGDWLDHFSAVAETPEGALELVSWPEPKVVTLPVPETLEADGLPAA